MHDGEYVARGISIHPPANATSIIGFDVPAGASIFQATLGLSDPDPYYGWASLSILNQNGVELYTTGPFGAGALDSVAIDLENTGTTSIFLVSESLGPNVEDHVTAFDARFTTIRPKVNGQSHLKLPLRMVNVNWGVERLKDDADRPFDDLTTIYEAAGGDDEYVPWSLTIRFQIFAFQGNGFNKRQAYSKGLEACLSHIRVDRLVEWCRDRQIYVCFALYDSPVSFRPDGRFISNFGRPNAPEFLENKRDKVELLRLCRLIVGEFEPKGLTQICAVNEPVPFSPRKLREFYKRLEHDIHVKSGYENVIIEMEAARGNPHKLQQISNLNYSNAIHTAHIWSGIYNAQGIDYKGSIGRSEAEIRERLENRLSPVFRFQDRGRDVLITEYGTSKKSRKSNRNGLYYLQELNRKLYSRGIGTCFHVLHEHPGWGVDSIDELRSILFPPNN